MDARSERLLELDAVRARLAAHAAFSGGEDLARALAPSPDPEEVARRRAETEEAIALSELGVSGPAGAHDVRPDVAEAARGGTLETAALGAVRTTAEVAIEAGRAVGARAGAAPLVAERVGAIVEAPLRRVADLVAAAVDERGDLRDDASPDLARVRRELARARNAAAETLRDLAARLRPHLQETFVTERGGRPVLAVKASSRSAVPGLVHDTSGSGQTLFIEPLALVEANNRVRELAAAERDEEERVLVALSRAVGEEAPALEAAVDALAHLDLVLARGALSRGWGGAPVEPDEEVVLEAARHPLLDPATAVPIDLDLRGIRALVVTGPNTGGKTVALKTLGLLALLHQCGLRPPARRARLPVFDAVLADIGDEQSIALSLSTFSGHVRSLMRIMEAAGRRSLVLLDEVAAGTDPVEGAALAQAVLERLVGQGALVATTSHLPELKAWATAAPGAAVAAVGFDPRTLHPTYELRVGEPGPSHGLAIAARLGLHPDVVAAARAGLAPERRALEDMLEEAAAVRARAMDERARAEAERRRAAEMSAEAARQEAALRGEIDRVRDAAEAERVAARAAAERELASLRTDLGALRAEIAAARRAERARASAGERATADLRGRDRDRRLGAASEAERRAEAALAHAAAPLAAGPVAVGDRVVDALMGFAGRVVALEDGEAEVQGPGARLRLPVERLRPDPRAEPPASPRQAGGFTVRAQPVAAQSEVDVRGRRAEEAREAVRERVDAAAMAGLPRVRVIHGKGTGALRAAVRDELARHPLVERADPAPPEEGGEGATVAVLGP